MKHIRHFYIFTKYYIYASFSDNAIRIIYIVENLLLYDIYIVLIIRRNLVTWDRHMTDNQTKLVRRMTSSKNSQIKTSVRKKITKRLLDKFRVEYVCTKWCDDMSLIWKYISTIHLMPMFYRYVYSTISANSLTKFYNNDKIIISIGF